MGWVVAQGAGCYEVEFGNNTEGEGGGKVYLRVVRSVVLVAKVCLYFSLCESCNLCTTDMMQGAKYTLHMSPRPHWRNEAKGGSRLRVGVIALLLGAAVADTVVEYDPWDRGVAISFLGAGFGPCVCCCIGEGGKVVLYCLSVFFSWLGCMD